MSIIITGGTGKVGSRLTVLLQRENIPHVIASRGGAAVKNGVNFDWLNPATFAAPFEHASPPVSAIFLVAPMVEDPAEPMNRFIDYARKEHNVNRFVLLGGSKLKPSGFFTGAVWQHLRDQGTEYSVLRPTWFMENFISPGHLDTIKGDRKIYTCTGDGKLPFISTIDIAAVALLALTSKQPPKTEHLLLGPESMNHAQVAAKISSELGHEIVHINVPPEQRRAAMLGAGFPEFLADFLVKTEIGSAKGEDDLSNDEVERVTGRPPMTFDAFVRENKKIWL